MIALAVFTDGRRAFAEQSIPRYEEALVGPITHRFVFDDSADPDYAEWLHELLSPRFAVISWPQRRGFGGNIASAWDFMAQIPQFEYVFHAEDDFLLDEPVDLERLIQILKIAPELDQVALLRHAFFPRELEAGGIIEEHPESYASRHVGGLRWLEHDRYFTTNPCLYRRGLCAYGWPDVNASEQVFTRDRVGHGRKMAYYGWNERRVTHIGSHRVGSGY